MPALAVGSTADEGSWRRAPNEPAPPPGAAGRAFAPAPVHSVNVARPHVDGKTTFEWRTDGPGAAGRAPVAPLRRRQSSTKSEASAVSDSAASGPPIRVQLRPDPANVAKAKQGTDTGNEASHLRERSRSGPRKVIGDKVMVRLTAGDAHVRTRPKQTMVEAVRGVGQRHGRNASKAAAAPAAGSPSPSVVAKAARAAAADAAAVAEKGRGGGAGAKKGSSLAPKASARTSAAAAAESVISAAATSVSTSVNSQPSNRFAAFDSTSSGNGGQQKSPRSPSRRLAGVSKKC